MLEAVRKCSYCGNEMMGVSAESYTQNPHCTGCLETRLRESSKEQGTVRTVRNGNYVSFVPGHSGPNERRRRQAFETRARRAALKWERAEYRCMLWELLATFADRERRRAKAEAKRRDAP